MIKKINVGTHFILKVNIWQNQEIVSSWFQPKKHPTFYFFWSLCVCFLELVYYSFGLYFILQVCQSSSDFRFGVLVLVASFIENKHFLLKFECDIFRFLRILFYFSIRSAFLRKLLVFCLGYWWGCCSCELNSWDLPEPSSLAFSTVIVSSVLRPGYLAVNFF
jgi:hypothetical protein